jgi:hypothetical protein
VDAVVSTTRVIEHTHQEEKIKVLRNAVLNSVAADAPDADTQAIFLNLLDRYTPSHLRLLALINDPPAWFASRGITMPQPAIAGNRFRVFGFIPLTSAPGSLELTDIVDIWGL